MIEGMNALSISITNTRLSGKLMAQIISALGDVKRARSAWAGAVQRLPGAGWE